MERIIVVEVMRQLAERGQQIIQHKSELAQSAISYATMVTGLTVAEVFEVVESGMQLLILAGVGIGVFARSLYDVYRLINYIKKKK